MRHFRTVTDQMTHDHPAPVRVELALRQRDLDALGHMNQAVYHELLEDVRRAFFRHTLPDLPFTGYVLVHVELDYRREVLIEHGYLIGECRVAELGRSRVELDNRLLLPDGDVAVEGRAVLVAWDEQTRKSRELTEHERQALLSAEPERLRQ
jgi:acyl-CoA thioester hydrolase